MKYLLSESMRNNENKKVHFSLQDPDVFYIYEGHYKIQNTYRIKSIAKKSAVNNLQLHKRTSGEILTMYFNFFA